MTDNIPMADDNTLMEDNVLGLPTEIWVKVAQYLNEKESITFGHICRPFSQITYGFLLQPYYDRLRVMDESLPTLLITPNTFIEFTKAIKKIQTRQQDEIAYLSIHHPVLIESLLKEYTSSPITIKTLEEQHRILDEANIQIIKAKIKKNSNELNLDGKHITRLPVSFFTTEDYVDFWKNLVSLSCSNNLLTTLNLPGLVKLKELNCDNNQLVILNLPGLKALKKLHCSYNQLTVLDLQEQEALKELFCSFNLLTTLPLQGKKKLKELYCSNNQLTSLYLQELIEIETIFCNNNRLSSLNFQGLERLDQLYCDYYQIKILNLHRQGALIRNSFNTPPAYLPNFSAHNNTNNESKRPLGEKQSPEAEKKQRTTPKDSPNN